MEQAEKEKLGMDILEMARFLHEEAVFAYSAYDMLKKLFECERSYQAEMALSPYMYYILRNASRDSIILILTRSYETKQKAKGRNIESLIKKCDLLFEQTKEDSSTGKDDSTDSSAETDDSTDGSSVIGIPYSVSIPRLWVKLDEKFAEYCKLFPSDDIRFIPLPDDFNFIWEFMKRIRGSLDGFCSQIKTYRDKVLAHNDRDAEAKMKEVNEKQPHWGNIEILIQFQLVFTSFITDAVTNAFRMHATAFANATDFETTLMVVRQGLAYQDIVKQTIENGGTLTVTTEELMKKSF